MKTGIIPQIRQIEAGGRPISLRDYHLDGSVTASFARAAEIFLDNGPLEGAGRIRYEKEEMGEEAYRISAKAEEIVIRAASGRGLMYALFTLSELDWVNDGALCEFEAQDAPTLSERALSDDISRGQIPTAAAFYALIRRLAGYKYNTYMPYMEDVFRFRAVPAWGRYSDPMDAQEWRDIIRYAAEWNITVRPIVNLLGHFDKMAHIRELQPLALRRADGSLTDCMDPTNPQVRKVIRAMLEEIVDCFGPGVIHCGGDEPVGLTEVFGQEEGGRLYIGHYAWVHGVLKELGCTMMMYADFFAPPWGDYSVPVERVRELPEDIRFVFWDYAVRDAYPWVDALHAQRIRLYLSPGSWNWSGFCCDIRNCYGNTKGLLKADGGRCGGMVMSSWGDGGDTLRVLAAPGEAIGGNYSWNAQSDYSYEELYLLLHRSLYGIGADEARKLEPVYHYQGMVPDPAAFRQEMWRDPLRLAGMTLPGGAEKLCAALEDAKRALEEMTPRRNAACFHALACAVGRALFTARKLLLLPAKMPETVEEALPCADAALRLAGELQALRELHRALWFETNRSSDWEICAARYDDLYDRLMIFSRNARLRRFWEVRKKAFEPGRAEG